MRLCKIHGITKFIKGKKPRCSKCAIASNSKCRKRKKEILIREHGGKCQRCGYNKCATALQFHHTDPEVKDFNISDIGRSKSLEKLRYEVKKCILLCANCHAEEEEHRRSLG